jgi:hypothetical protein
MGPRKNRTYGQTNATFRQYSVWGVQNRSQMAPHSALQHSILLILNPTLPSGPLANHTLGKRGLFLKIGTFLGCSHTTVGTTQEYWVPGKLAHVGAFLGRSHLLIRAFFDCGRVREVHWPSRRQWQLGVRHCVLEFVDEAAAAKAVRNSRHTNQRLLGGVPLEVSLEEPDKLTR